MKKRWQEYKKGLNDSDNHNGMFTILEPDILEYEIKRALRNIDMNISSEWDRIPVKLFQILKDNALKCCTQYIRKFGKLRSGHRIGKGQFLFQPQRRAMPKNVQTTAKLWSFHMTAR